ncbi:hypothetical protein ABKN59_004947 [Abortiporus biennis]
MKYVLYNIEGPKSCKIHTGRSSTARTIHHHSPSEIAVTLSSRLNNFSRLQLQLRRRHNLSDGCSNTYAVDTTASRVTIDNCIASSSITFLRTFG